MSVDRSMDQENVRYTSAFKKMEILPFAPTNLDERGGHYAN